MTATPTLYSSGEVITRIGLGLTYATLHRWIRMGAIHPTRPPAGTGSDIGFSERDVATLDAIAHVRSDLATLGLPCPWNLIGQLWNQLTNGGLAELTTGTVEISVRIGLEDE